VEVELLSDDIRVQAHLASGFKPRSIKVSLNAD
jgi:hypothetical protein